MKNLFKNIGPGTLVAAAFIGPGTVTVCSMAGASFGYSLLWAMLLSVIATIVLQEMAGRIGIITQKGLAEVVREQISHPLFRKIIVFIIILAIILGNTAYESGNIGGAVLGLEAITGDNSNKNFVAIAIASVSFILLYIGSYKFLEKIFIFLIIVMSLSFIISAFLVKPDIFFLLKGLFLPSVTEKNLLTVISLIGTTVVPYNLFLHASLVKEKWKSEKDIHLSRKDTLISIGLGGVVSMCIIISSASLHPGKINNIIDLTRSLEPLYGVMARYFIGIGLIAAGITSAVTAPLAAAYVANSCFGWKASNKDTRFRLVWMLVLFIGTFFLFFGIKPIIIIQFAQMANGILLPVMAVLLFWVSNNKRILGKFKNTFLQNIITIIIILITLFLGLKSILKVFDLI
ncbi:Nramp family divalent metal transporter [Abyssalbus ytuae]|uniref:Nramp family divalent metal transporter n=1 Tax=Abyssalbus ytuae TaxID=2926907 RepID=A0A9E6ZL15_9FLAO|nr:Nramp family divalent metal transporter [Abyssalbus ytuae]UOB17714.1 Nramp family divalent metal transporter [Abyssalbus ytuae]